jgi:hypothetical protein
VSDIYSQSGNIDVEFGIDGGSNVNFTFLRDYLIYGHIIGKSIISATVYTSIEVMYGHIIGKSAISSDVVYTQHISGSIIGKSVISSSSFDTQIISGSIIGKGVVNSDTEFRHYISGHIIGKGVLSSTVSQDYFISGSIIGKGIIKSYVGIHLIYGHIIGVSLISSSILAQEDSIRGSVEGGFCTFGGLPFAWKEFGNNFAYGESPFYKDDGVICIPVDSRHEKALMKIWPTAFKEDVITWGSYRWQPPAPFENEVRSRVYAKYVPTGANRHYEALQKFFMGIPLGGD